MPNQEFEYFCENVKFLRQRASLSQKEMARIMKVSVKTLSRIEHGELPLRLGVEVAMRLCSRFCVSADQLLFQRLAEAQPEPGGTT